MNTPSPQIQGSGDGVGNEAPVTSKAIHAARQKWPEDAFVAWKREHHAKGDTECPDDDSEHCAFMSGIAYAEDYLTRHQSLIAAAQDALVAMAAWKITDQQRHYLEIGDDLRKAFYDAHDKLLNALGRDVADDIQKFLSKKPNAADGPPSKSESVSSPATVSASPDSAPSKCAGCGTPLNEGEAATFTVCDACWDLKGETAPALRSPEVSGPRTLDAKWLDPECWDGCQSLIYKHRCEKYEVLLRRVLEWCDSGAPNFEIDADTIRAAINSTTPPTPSAPKKQTLEEI